MSEGRKKPRLLGAVMGCASAFGIAALTQCAPPPSTPAPSACQQIDGTFKSSKGQFAQINQSGCAFTIRIRQAGAAGGVDGGAVGQVDSGNFTLTLADGHGCTSERHGHIGDITPMSFVSYTTGTNGQCGVPADWHETLIWTRVAPQPGAS